MTRRRSQWTAAVDSGLRTWAALAGLLILLLGGRVVAQDRGHPENLIEVATLSRVTTGCAFTEGPVWSREGFLLFTDIRRNRIECWKPGDGAGAYRENSQGANGLTFDLDGYLLACEGGARRVTRTVERGEIQTLASRYEGKRLNSPNDIVVSKTGRIYFTDPPFAVSEASRELDFAGVYSIGLDGSLRLENREMNRPNGLAFSPDESVLYVDDSADKLVKDYPVEVDGKLGEPKVFGSLDGFGADGMKVDRAGNVYATGPRGVWIWDAQGNWVGLLETPETPSNCAFGEDGKTLFITARTSVYKVRTKIEGIRPVQSGGTD
jgi:gluconolactonase